MLRQDIRYAFRTLLKNKAFTAVAVACLSLGIGVNATIFSVVDGVVLNPYPYPESDRLIVLHLTNYKLGITRGSLSYPDYKDIRDANSTLEAIGAFTGRSLTIADGTGDPERYLGAAVSWTLFPILGARPAIGRDFNANDDRPGAEPVVMLSDDVWRTRYASDPSVVGRATNVNGVSHTVIGVMPPKFAFPENQRLWVPLAKYGEPMPRDQRGVQVFARLKRGVSLDQARADIAGLAAGLAKTYPAERGDWGAGARPIREWLLPDQVKLMMLTMMGAVTLVLLIACANVANLLLARASVRHREISIRAALGAGRWRIVRQLLTEAVLIGAISAPIGMGLAWAGIRLLDLGMPADGVPYFIRWSLDARSLVYTIAISLLTGVVFGLAPALQASRGNLQESLKEGGRGNAGGSRAWLRSTLVVVEIALSLVLLVGSSLFMRSFLNLQTAALGFDTRPLMTMRFYLPGAQYDTPEAKAQRVEDIVRRVESLPGVQAAFASNFVPIGGGGGGANVLVEGTSVERGKEPFVGFIATSPHLRQVVDVPLVRGRDITDAEGATKAPVALINQAMAKRLWPDQDPLGRRFRRAGDRTPEWFTVIGIVADFRHFPPQGDDPPAPNAYVPYPFEPALNTGITIRVAGEPASITAAAREQIRASDGSLPVFDVRSMEEHRLRSFWQQRLFGIMFAVFGGVALLLASVGVYGVLSYSVSQRTQEIGVRVALGAERRDVMRLIVGYGLRLAAVGVAIGLVLARAATPAIRTQLYNVAPTDAMSFGGVAIFLTLVAILASYFPARRAMAVDPIIALRND
jgi:putative ABC transport system permease protein